MDQWVQIPSYSTCFVCGDDNPIGLAMKFKGKDKSIESKFTLKPEYCGYKNIVHGGIISAILDEGMGWTGWLTFKKYYLTLEIKIRLKTPVRPGVNYTLQTTMLKQKGRIFFAEGFLIDPNGVVVVEGKGKYFIVDEMPE